MLLGSRDPQSAIALAQALPAGETRAIALVNVASGWAQREPAAAARWTAAQADLPPPALRGAFSYWRLQDAAAAQAWLKSAGLPAETKAQLRGGVR